MAHGPWSMCLHESYVILYESYLQDVLGYVEKNKFIWSDSDHEWPLYLHHHLFSASIYGALTPKS